MRGFMWSKKLALSFRSYDDDLDYLGDDDLHEVEVEV